MLGFIWQGGQNLIDGKLAEEEDLYVASCDPATIKVAGASSMPTREYGKYFLTLGSSISDWYCIECHGVPNVTVPFTKFDLWEAIKEFCTVWDEFIPLLPSIGGSPIGLLMDPILIGILPSGIGVYWSVFTDIYGSEICFGVTHIPLIPCLLIRCHFSRMNYLCSKCCLILKTDISFPFWNSRSAPTL